MAELHRKWSTIPKSCVRVPRARSIDGKRVEKAGPIRLSTSGSESAADGKITRYFSLDARTISPRRGLKIEHRRPKTSPSGLRMTSHIRSIRHGSCLFSAVKRCVTSVCVKKKFGESSSLEPGFARLGTDTDNRDSQSECTGEQEKGARSRRIRKSKAETQER